MNLTEITLRKEEIKNEIVQLKEEYKKREEGLQRELSRLKDMEAIFGYNLDYDKISMARTILTHRGDILSKCEGRILAEAAIIDIANGCPNLKKQYFGNKTYSGYYQNSDHTYGYGPAHGSICEEIGLNAQYRKSQISAEQAEACIYYLRNYKLIKEAKTALV